MSANARQNKALDLASQREQDPSVVEHYVYPNGGTAKSLAYDIAQKAARIHQVVQENDQVPPWVLMLLSQASFCMDHVERFVSYYGAQPSRYSHKGRMSK